MPPETTPWRDIWTDVKDALTDKRKHKELTIWTYDSDARIVFEATIPRQADNNLFGSRRWRANSREEAAAFLRAVADLIEKGQ